MKCKKRKKIAFHSINIISHCMVIGHWKCENNMQNTVVFFPIRIATESCTCSRTCQWHFSLSWGFAISLQKKTQSQGARERSNAHWYRWLTAALPSMTENSREFNYIRLYLFTRFDSVQHPMTYVLYIYVNREVCWKISSISHMLNKVSVCTMPTVAVACQTRPHLFVSSEPNTLRH